MDGLSNSEPGTWRGCTLGGSSKPGFRPIRRGAGYADGVARGSAIARSGWNRSLPEWVRGDREARPGLK